MAKARVLRVKLWSELPEVLEPGEYCVDGVMLRLKEPLEKEDAKDLVSLVKRVDKK